MIFCFFETMQHIFPWKRTMENHDKQEDSNHRTDELTTTANQLFNDNSFQCIMKTTNFFSIGRAIAKRKRNSSNGSVLMQ
jgi:hypothetical protein